VTQNNNNNKRKSVIVMCVQTGSSVAKDKIEGQRVTMSRHRC